MWSGTLRAKRVRERMQERKTGIDRYAAAVVVVVVPLLSPLKHYRTE